MRVGKAAIMLAILLAGALPALAQETTGTIKGRIVDAQGLAVRVQNRRRVRVEQVASAAQLARRPSLTMPAV